MEKNSYAYVKVGNEVGYFLNWRNKWCVISVKDKKRVSKHTWSYDASRDVWRTVIKGKKVLLHRFIKQVDNSEMYVDHINHNRSDCRRSNLRVVTPAQNAYNRSLYKSSTSGVKGVLRFGNKWVARIGYNKSVISLGTYDTFESACRARLIAEKEFHQQYRYNTIGA